MCRCREVCAPARSSSVIADNDIDMLDPQQLRQALRAAQAQVVANSELVAHHERTVAFKQTVIDKLTHEMAVLKRLKFAATSERFSPEQKSLLEEAIDEDLESLAREVERLVPVKDSHEKRQPKRQALPANLPRREVRHEPEDTTCGCGCELKRIGEDVAEKLDYAPGTFTVERHVRGKWACAQCRSLIQAPVPAHVVDKGLATAGLMAHVTVAKYIDHQPLYRQEQILGRAGYAVPRLTQAEWIGAIGVQVAPLVQAMREDLLSRRVLHADETPVAMLKPGLGKTHRAYLWSYCTTGWDDINAVVFDFAEAELDAMPVASLASTRTAAADGAAR